MVNQFELAVVHPLVLLSVVDHYHRVAKDTRKRVLGVLLGEVSKGRIDITNSFAVPFEEDDRDTKIWFLDHSYMEAMYGMFKKVNAREKIVGWYHTGPRLRESDLDIQELMTTYCAHPILVVCEVEPKDMGLPTTAYYAKDQIREDGTQKSQKVFVNIPTEVGATEAEEIGVEHLLRDVKDATVSTLATEVGRMVTGLRGLKSRLSEIQHYLSLVVAGTLPVNHDILYQLQDVMNLLPNLGVEELSHAFAVKSNDMMLVIYLASVIRSVLALHNLIENKEHRVWKETAGLPEKNGKNGKLEAGKNGAAKELDHQETNGTLNGDDSLKRQSSKKDEDGK
eukprot:jgi/Botrbrau1/22929/Bobra.0030s0007.1